MKLSIITINYNNRDGLRKTIESVVNQTCRDFEYIIIDGGSTDGSVDIIKQYADRIDYWVSEPDKGIFNAMNKGIFKASGEYLNFMNSGDTLYDEYTISRFLNITSNEDVIYGNIIDDKTNKRMLYLSSSDLTAADFFHNSIPHQASFIKKNLFEKCGFYDETLRVSSDWKFFIDAIIFHNSSIRYVNIKFARYENFGISTTEHNDEIEKVLNGLFPKRILSDYPYVLSLKDVTKSELCKILYSILYRLATLIKQLKAIIKSNFRFNKDY